jgi:hypothetical protein
MATVINNPGVGTTTDSNSGAGFLVGALVFLVALILILYYGIPALRSAARSTSGASGAQINVPDKINVDVNQNPSQPNQ